MMVAYYYYVSYRERGQRLFRAISVMVTSCVSDLLKWGFEYLLKDVGEENVDVSP